MAKFVSKTGNLCIILRPGMQAQPLTGTPAVPTIFVRFSDGMATVSDPKLEEMMFIHPGYNSDFFHVKENEIDPFKKTRQDSEPSHIMTEMKYGHPVKRVESKPITQFPPEIMNAIRDMSMELGKQIAEQALPGMVEAKLKEIVAKHQEAAVQTGYKQIVTDENNEVTVTPADETQIKPKVKAKK